MCMIHHCWWWEANRWIMCLCDNLHAAYLVLLGTQPSSSGNLLQLCWGLLAEELLQERIDSGRLGGGLHQNHQTTVPCCPGEVVGIEFLLRGQQLICLLAVKLGDANVIWKVVLRVHHFSTLAVSAFGLWNGSPAGRKALHQ